MNKYHFFWKNKSPFSNWYKIDFIVDVNDTQIKFNCVEQYMMYVKAILFNDIETANNILMVKNPSEQKALGRTVKNFNNKIWDKYKYELVKNGIVQKFKQNPDILNELLKHSGEKFVEASPYDRIWGIGFEEYNALENIDKWGENLLGEILTEVCNELK